MDDVPQAMGPLSTIMPTRDELWANALNGLRRMIEALGPDEELTIARGDAQGCLFIVTRKVSDAETAEVHRDRNTFIDYDAERWAAEEGDE
jgi:hypothetical protein